eukprot:1190089-Prorocentrum_minimum.AAC.4
MQHSRSKRSVHVTHHGKRYPHETPIEVKIGWFVPPPIWGMDWVLEIWYLVKIIYVQPIDIDHDHLSKTFIAPMSVPGAPYGKVGVARDNKLHSYALLPKTIPATSPKLHDSSIGGFQQRSRRLRFLLGVEGTLNVLYYNFREKPPRYPLGLFLRGNPAGVAIQRSADSSRKRAPPSGTPTRIIVGIAYMSTPRSACLEYEWFGACIFL